MSDPCRVCPWWKGYLLDNPFRRRFDRLDELLAPRLEEGDWALDFGAGMGLTSRMMARIVGPRGRVVAVDLQKKMLDRLTARAQRAGLLDIIDPHIASPRHLELDSHQGRFHFALALAVIHEVPDAGQTLRQLAATLRPGGSLLIAEPSGHVDDVRFEAQLAAARQAELVEQQLFDHRSYRCALLRKPS